MRTDRIAGETASGSEQEERVLLEHPANARATGGAAPAVTGDSPAASADVVELSALAETPQQSGVGVVAPYDFALDRELWRWAPDDVSLYVTRLPFVPVPVTVDQASALSDGDNVARATRDLLAPEPLVVGYACASGSFVHGAEGEHRLRGGGPCGGGGPYPPLP